MGFFNYKHTKKNGCPCAGFQKRVSIIVVTLPNPSKKKRTRTIKNNKSMKRTIIFALVAVVGLMGAASVAWGQESPRWLRKNAISPDGKQIAFSYKGDIYVVPVAGGRAQQLTSNPAYDSDPVWTPDSKYLVFSS